MAGRERIWPVGATSLRTLGWLLVVGFAVATAAGFPRMAERWAAAIGGKAKPMFAAMEPGGEALRTPTVVKPLSCEPLPNVPGKAIATALVEFPPGAYTGAHRHPGSVSAFVVKGAIRSQMQGAPARTYHAGDVWFEPPWALHLFAENASNSEPATLLATFVVDQTCGTLVIPEPNSVEHATSPSAG